MDRPEQAEWSETIEEPVEDSADAPSDENSPDPAPADGEGSIAHRLNRVTRYASATGNTPSPEPAATPDPMAQPAAGLPESAAPDPAPSATPHQPVRAPEDHLEPAPAVVAPPETATEQAQEDQAPAPADAQPVPTDSGEPMYEPAAAPDSAPSAAAGEVLDTGGLDSQAPEETPIEANVGAWPAAAKLEPGSATVEVAEPEPAAAQPSIEAPAAPPAPAAVQATPPADQPGPEPSPAAAAAVSPEPGAASGEVLTVGRGIRLVAKLCECAELLVEGHLEATARAKHLMVAQGGHFIGSAEVDTAEIHGHFEGNLTVTERLLIRATGSVAGTTCYQEIVIEAGGRIMGNTQRLSETAATGDTAA